MAPIKIAHIFFTPLKPTPFFPSLPIFCSLQKKTEGEKKKKGLGRQAGAWASPPTTKARPARTLASSSPSVRRQRGEGGSPTRQRTHRAPPPPPAYKREGPRPCPSFCPPSCSPPPPLPLSPPSKPPPFCLLRHRTATTEPRRRYPAVENLRTS